MSKPRRFPPPWSVEDTGAAFIVKDSAGQKLAYVYFEDDKPVSELLLQVLIVVAFGPIAKIIAGGPKATCANIRVQSRIVS